MEAESVGEIQFDPTIVPISREDNEERSKKCQHVYCTKSACAGPCCPMSHMTESLLTRVPAGFTLEFNCGEGSALSGNESVECLITGHWSRKVQRSMICLETYNSRAQKVIRRNVSKQQIQWWNRIKPFSSLLLPWQAVSFASLGSPVGRIRQPCPKFRFIQSSTITSFDNKTHF